MPNIGIEVNGVRKRWEEIDLRADLTWAQPASPSIIAYLKSISSERADVDDDEVSASQYEKGIRALHLEATVDYYVNPVDQLSSMMGTKTHALINKDYEDGFISETRLFFDEDGIRYGSAKCDTFHTPTGLLEDLKNIKWYAVESMITQGALAAKPGYVYQLNLFRVLMKMPQNQEILFEKYPWLKPEDLHVKRMQLSCAPPDLNEINRKKAQKITDEARFVPIDVPFIPDDEVLDAYRKKYHDKLKAKEQGYAPLCSEYERWQKDWGFPLKCAKFCPVAEACRAMSAAAGERHPLDEWEVLKERRAAQKRVTESSPGTRKPRRKTAA